MIECDNCEHWFHCTCVGLSKTEATLVSDGADMGIKWFCLKCKPFIVKVPNNSDAPKSADEKLDAIYHDVKELTAKLANQTTSTVTSDKLYSDALKASKEEILKSIDETSKQVQWHGNLMKKNIDHADSETRKLNAILFGLAEQLEKKVANQVQEFMTTQCHLQNHGPVNAYRLGKVQEGQKNPRPIKVLFKDEDDKWAFLKRVNEVFKDDPSIYCLKDRPKEVRDHEYELRKATRALREENPSKEFRPRDMKVQTKNETGEWVDMMRERSGKWVMPTTD